MSRLEAVRASESTGGVLESAAGEHASGPKTPGQFAEAVLSGVLASLLTPAIDRRVTRWKAVDKGPSGAAARLRDFLRAWAARYGAVFSVSQGVPLFVNAGTFETAAYAYSPYEPFTREVFAHHCKPGARIMDVGAQFGIYTVIGARRSPGGQVVAFEPEPNNFALLCLNARINRVADRISCHELAVGDSAGEADLYVYQGSDSHAFYRHPEALVKEVLRREVVAADDFLGATRFDLIKLDIEGHEPFALEGMKKTLEASDDVVLICELAPEYLRRAGVDPCDYLAQLRSLGFEPRVIDEDRKLVRPLEKDFLESGPPGRAVNLLCKRRPS